MNSQGILIVGGYGVVGRRIATELAADYPGRVVIGGRNLARADEIATDDWSRRSRTQDRYCRAVFHRGRVGGRWGRNQLHRSA